MLAIKKTGIAFDEKELIKLEQIITDQDEAAAFKFLKRAVYNKIAKDRRVDSSPTSTPREIRWKDLRIDNRAKM